MWDRVCLASVGKAHSWHNHKIKKKIKSCVCCTRRQDGALISFTEESANVIQKRRSWSSKMSLQVRMDVRFQRMCVAIRPLDF